MRFPRRSTLIVLGLLALFPAPAAAQDPPAAAADQTRCADAEPPTMQPPQAGSPTLLRCVELRAHPTNETFVDPATYQNYLQTALSVPSQGKWAPYSEQLIQGDFWNLWNTGFLDDLWIEVIDEPFANGVAGKHVIFHFEERSRVKVVDYMGAEQVSIGAIEDALSERSIRVNLDSFVDQSVIRQIRSVIRELYADKGFHDVEIKTEMRELPGGPKLTHLVFNISSGPKFQIREIIFDGNEQFSDGKLRGELKENRQPGLFTMFTGAGTYRETKFADDAEAIERFYLKNGYVQARVGLPQVETIEDSEDGTERAVRLRIPVDEGLRYRVGKLSITGNKSLAGDALLTLFKIQPGDWFDREQLDKGVEEVQKVYSQLGFYKIGVLPDFCFPGDPASTCPVQEGGPTAAAAPTAPAAPATDAAPTADQAVPGADPVVDITLEMVEGERFFVNRITFTGNSTTHDAVIRREMRIQEGLPFNTAMLQESIRRLNQLGYFQPFEGSNEEVEVTEVPGQKNLVDVTMRVVEQNRNQITFGAGVSQYDGFFGQLAYQTSNFLGRGEVLAVSLQKGAYADNYQVSFSEPYMFDRPITMGADVFKRTFSYPFQFSQDSTGGNLVLGLPATDYSRFFLSYSYQAVRVYDINEAFLNPQVLAFNPLLIDSLLLNVNGRRTVSKISPSWVFNTVNQPIFPSDGTRYTVGLDYAGLGGNTSYVQGRLEGIWYHPVTRRMSIGMRAQARYIRPWGDTTILPIFEKYFLGGEYDIRGFDLRSISPRDPRTGLFTGGNKSLVFNAEYAVDIASPVRVLAFFDAGQVQDVGDPFRWKDPIEIVRSPGVIVPVLSDPFRFSTSVLTPTLARPLDPEIVSIGETASFKVSTGFELRFFMPVVNVPFRLIAAYNPSRGRIFTNNGLLTPKFTFRFAVGTTF